MNDGGDGAYSQETQAISFKMMELWQKGWDKTHREDRDLVVKTTFASIIFHIMKVLARLKSRFRLILLNSLLFTVTATVSEGICADQACPSETGVGVSRRLSNGILMPRVGIGTAGMRGEQTISSVKLALENGIRMVDTAESKEWYDPASVGTAVEESGVQREEIFITTKINPRNYGLKASVAALNESLRELKLEYIDLLLLHFPECWDGIPSCKDVNPEGTWEDAWRVLEVEYEKGKLRAIGLSNFNANLLRYAIARARIKPHVVQNWMDPFHQDKEVRAICDSENIGYTAYSSLGGQWRLDRNPVFENEAIKNLSALYGWSVPKLILTWQLASGVIVIPRSTKKEHIVENARLNKALLNGEKNLGIQPEHMNILNSLTSP